MQKLSPKRRIPGFSLLEVVISMAVLLVVMGTVFEQITLMQRKAVMESANVDQMQESRQFVDEAVRDLHMAGYPNSQMFSPLVTDQSKMAAGLVSVSPTQIIMEGDINGDGNVESLTYSYVAADPNDSNCPCLRRSGVGKINADSFSQPQALSYTEIQHVLPPAQGQDIFTFYNQTGAPVDVSAGANMKDNQTTVASISTVKVNLAVANGRDPASGQVLTNSFSATARLDQ
jgi:prepilin-type N-terminal cleavage/methylation domain-containing protein